jgi:phage terminase large subunit-like protein
MYEYASKVADGVIDDDRFLPIMYELDSRDEWTQEDMWHKANPSLGAIKKVEDLQDKVNRAKNFPQETNGILCKDFNVRENVGGSWLTFEEVNNTETFSIDELRDSYAIGGADLSATTDLTCATLIIMKKGSEKKYVIQQYFIPEEVIEKKIVEDKVPYDKWRDRGLVTLTSGNRVDYTVVTNWFVKMFKEYEIRPLWIYFDSWNAQYWVQDMRNYGFEMVECRQGYKTLSPAMRELSAELSGKRVNYNNNPILKWNLSNVVAKQDENGNIRPVKGTSTKQRIDGMVSLLIAYVGLVEHYADYKSMIERE